MKQYDYYVWLVALFVAWLIDDGQSTVIMAVDPFIVGASIAAGASLLGTGVTNAANASNVSEMRQYNDPVRQRRRYEQAGINPMLAMTSGQLGSGNSEVVPQRENYQVNYGELVQPILQQQSIESQDKVNSANARYQNARSDTHFAETLTALAEAAERIDGMKVDSKYKESLMREIDARVKLANETFLDDVALRKNEAELAHEKVLTERFSRELQSKQFSESVRLNNAQINQLSALAANLSTQADEMVKNGVSQRKVDAWVRSEAAARVRGLNLDNKQKKALMPWVVGSAFKEYSSVNAGVFGNVATPTRSSEQIVDLLK